MPGANKLERLNQSLKKALGTVIRQELPDHPLLVIVDVLVDQSLQSARVWVKATADELMILESKRPAIQAALGSQLKIRYTPKLTFLADDHYLDSLDQLYQQIDR
jgi:ribosome-binding factor A